MKNKAIIVILGLMLLLINPPAQASTVTEKAKKATVFVVTLPFRIVKGIYNGAKDTAYEVARIIYLQRLYEGR